MNEALLKNWINTVTENDTTWHLGDVSVKKGVSQEHLNSMISRVPGKKYLILGNHDRQLSEDTHYWRDVGFDEVFPYPIIYKDFYILSHEWIEHNGKTPYFNIHGHSHQHTFDPATYYNVAVELNEYKPVSFTDILKKTEEYKKR